MATSFTDLFIKRPVLSMVVSILLFILGLNAMSTMQIRQYPAMENTVITVTTAYPGASADTVEGYVTAPLEQSIASADGVDYFTSSSTDGQSTITVYMRLNFDPYNAYTTVQSKVQEVEDQLPGGCRLPSLSQSTGSALSMMYISFSSPGMTTSEITAYLADVIQPQLQTINGVAQANILGGNTYAMRIWMDRDKMASLGVTPNDVAQVLQANNYQSSGGMSQGSMVQVNLSADTGATTAAQFQQMAIRANSDGSLVTMGDIARIELGASSYTSSVTFNDLPTVLISIDTTSTANPLEVINAVNQKLPVLAKQYPESLKGEVVYDATLYIKDSIKEVIQTIVEASLIVTVVIFLFLGSLRSVLIPVITLPLSLVGIFFVMEAMGYSINLLTLLALVLAIGLVVDDAILVLENTYRHLQEGLNPIESATTGAREIVSPVISTTIALVAVYAPIGMMSGLTGALFSEFALTLAGSVVVSGIIALTLSPMMCSRLLNVTTTQEPLVLYIDEKFNTLKDGYASMLNTVLKNKGPCLLFGALTLASNVFLFSKTPGELAPMEDQGILLTMSTGPKYANLDYTKKYTGGFTQLYKSLPGYSSSFVVNGGATVGDVDTAMSIMLLKPWSERDVSQTTVFRMLAKKVHFNPGLKVFPVQLSPLPTSTGTYPIEFVITTIAPYDELYKVSEAFLEKAQASGKFLFLSNSLDYNQASESFLINRDLAGQMGISMQDIANTFGLSLSGNYVNFFTMGGKSYKVIPELDRAFMGTAADLDSLSVKNKEGNLVPLDALGHFEQIITPNARSHFQQLHSATIQGAALPDLVSTSEALATLKSIAAEALPNNYSYDYSGDLRAYVAEGNALVFTFLLALTIIYLVLAGQFESFRDPFVILTAVPMATCGALIPLCLGLGTMNIYSQIGLITLIGLISKHGILMVEFSHQLHDEDPLLTKEEAVEQAASIRLRPILMTTASMVLGVVPLLLAHGPGAVSRFDIGVTLASGMTIGTLFTLFIVPVIFTLRARDIAAFWASSLGLCLLLSPFV